MKKRYFCIAVDLPAHGNSPLVSDTIGCVKETVSSLGEMPFLVGYSLGGRIALRIGQELKLPVSGSFAISSHPGIDCPEEKTKRIEEDLVWGEHLRRLPPEEFLRLWYARPVFSSLRNKPLLLEELVEKRLFQNPEELSTLMQELSLGKQKRISSFSENVRLLYGEEDTKFKNLYDSLEAPVKKIEIQGAGHTVLVENPKLCAEVLLTEISLMERVNL